MDSIRPPWNRGPTDSHSRCRNGEVSRMATCRCHEASRVPAEVAGLWLSGCWPQRGAVNDQKIGTRTVERWEKGRMCCVVDCGDLSAIFPELQRLRPRNEPDRGTLWDKIEIAKNHHRKETQIVLHRTGISYGLKSVQGPRPQRGRLSNAKHGPRLTGSVRSTRG